MAIKSPYKKPVLKAQPAPRAPITPKAAPATPKMQPKSPTTYTTMPVKPVSTPVSGGGAPVSRDPVSTPVNTPYAPPRTPVRPSMPDAAIPREPVQTGRDAALQNQWNQKAQIVDQWNSGRAGAASDYEATRRAQVLQNAYRTQRGG